MPKKKTESDNNVTWVGHISFRKGGRYWTPRKPITVEGTTRRVVAGRAVEVGEAALKKNTRVDGINIHLQVYTPSKE